MRILVAGAVLALVACGGHRAAAPACTLQVGEGPSPRTGEHSLLLTSSCAFRAIPRVALDSIPFTFVQEGGTRGTHRILFDKYRCDIRASKVAHAATVNGARVAFGQSLMDWCPGERISTIVHVYLGGLHGTPTWRGVLRDVYDGSLDTVWPCGALRGAIAHLPVDGPVYSAIPGILHRAAARSC